MMRLSKTEWGLVGLWLVLAAITLVAFDTAHLQSWVRDDRFQGTLVIVLAFVKVRLIMLDFMEVRSAPVALRVVVEGWVFVACGGLVLMLFGII